MLMLIAVQRFHTFTKHKMVENVEEDEKDEKDH